MYIHLIFSTAILRITMPEQLKTFIDSLFKATQNETTPWKIQLLQNWPTIIGQLGSKIQLEKIYDDTLVLGVFDSCWLQELYCLTPVIIESINAHLEQPYIKNLRLKKIGKKPIAQKRYAPKPIPFTLTVMLTAQEKAALTAIKDVELRNAMEAFLKRCYRER